MVGARVASADDGTAVAELRRLARSELLEQRGGEQFTAAEMAGPSVDVPPSTPDAAVVVGTIGEDVVGVATVLRSGRRARLEELFTHPGARGVGIGHAMLGEVSRLARGWECTDLDSYALPGDRDTKNFFESHAMKSRLLIVHTAL